MDFNIFTVVINYLNIEQVTGRYKIGKVIYMTISLRCNVTTQQ